MIFIACTRDLVLFGNVKPGCCFDHMATDVKEPTNEKRRIQSILHI